MGDRQLADHYGLNVVCRVIVGTGTGVGVFIHLAVAPDPLLTQLQNILDSIPERDSIQQFINAAVVGAVLVVMDPDQFLSTGNQRIREEILRVAPNNCLHPGVHDPDIVAVPDIVYPQGVGLVGEDPAAVGVEVRHHGLYRRVIDRLGTIPGMALQ